MYSKILGTGSYLPTQVRSNSDLERWLIRAMSGSLPVPASANVGISDASESVVTMAHQAAKNALDMAV